MKLTFFAEVEVDTTTGKIVLSRLGREENVAGPPKLARLRICLVPPRKGQGVHVVKDDLPVGFAATARQLVRRLVDALITNQDLEQTT